MRTNVRSHTLGLISIALALVSATACKNYVEYNPNANVAIDFIASASKLAFGVSTGDSTQNNITVNSDRTITLTASNAGNNAGKVSGTDDGISFFYKEVDTTKNFRLSGTVTVAFFGGVDAGGAITSNGQEAFGLMARDYVPQYTGVSITDTSYHMLPTDSSTGKAVSSIPGGCSNMVMVGAVKRGVRAAIRRGVTGSAECITNPDRLASAGKSVFEYWPRELIDYSMYPTLDSRPEFPAAGTVYKFSLIKTNSAFVATITPPADRGVPQEYTMPYPNINTVIKTDKYYVGFFAARSTKVTVSNVSYFESNAADDAPAITPLPEIITPRFSILSPSTASDSDYTLYCSSNVKGYVSVTQEGKLIPGVDYLTGTWYSSTLPGSKEAAVMSDICMFEITALPLKSGDNVFHVEFYPEESDGISTNAAIKKVFTVSNKAYFDVSTPIIVSPAGRSGNEGTRASPLDLNTAIAYVQPGQRITMLDGTYIVKSLRIPRYSTGKIGQYKELYAEHLDQVFIDFNKDLEATGFQLNGDFWQLWGFHVRNTPDKVKGLTITGNNNIVDFVKTYNNGDTGLQISGSSAESRTWWPVGNKIRYCESYNNLDAAMNDADGFAAKLTVGKGNIFEWCVAHHNCDDGWDLFTKKETQTIWPVTLEYCITYRNGTMMDGYKTNSGRNGFKLGGEGLAVEHVLRNCLAFQNGAHGYTSNSNTAVIFDQCTAFDNGLLEWGDSTTSDARNFTIYNGSGRINIFNDVTGLLSLYSDGSDKNEDKIKLKSDACGYIWYGDGTGSARGTATRNFGGSTGASPVILADATHKTVDIVKNIVAPVNAQGFIERDATTGHYMLNDFLVLKDNVAADSPGAHFPQ